MLVLQNPHTARGFTLIELMIVLVIAAVLLMIGTPMLSEFVADQRVRTVSSDIMADIAFARAKALENSRRVYLERTGATWTGGWHIFVDVNNDTVFNAGDEELKVFSGFPAGTTLSVCSNVAEFANTIIFRPDGRIVRNTAVTQTDGLYVIDTLGDAAVANDKIRGILFGGLGRATVVKMNGLALPAGCV
jgi:prepilin-type N-terminal cleavage/methylation domain-containing protein